jgi:hypothetical protein
VPLEGTTFGGIVLETLFVAALSLLKPVPLPAVSGRLSPPPAFVERDSVQLEDCIEKQMQNEEFIRRGA